MLIRNRLCVSLAILIILAWSGWTFATDLEQKVIKTRLPNGLTVLMLERKFSPTVSLYIRYRVGAVDEAKGQTGAAHFLEHMMFKGTTTIGSKDYPSEVKLIGEIERIGQALDDERKKKEKADGKIIDELSGQLKQLQSKHRSHYISNEIDRLYTSNGGQGMNAATGQDVTTYFISLPANKVELWARIEADRLLNPVFREFYTERDVILEERRQRVESSPDGKLYEAFMNTAYQIHPYGRPILGLLNDLTYMSPTSVRSIHQYYLSPSNIVIAIVGDVDPQQTLKIIDRYFGLIPHNQQPPSNSIPVEPLQNAERKVEVSFDANPSIIIGYHKPTAPSKADYALDVLEAILSKGRTSRLYAKLVIHQQIAESIRVQNGIPATRYPNLFTVFGRPRSPHTSEQLLNAIFLEIDNVKNGVTEKELIKAKKQIKMDYMRSLDSNAELASVLSYYELLLGDYRYFARYISAIDEISAADIRNVAIQYLTAENRTTAILKKTPVGHVNNEK